MKEREFKTVGEDNKCDLTVLQHLKAKHEGWQGLQKGPQFSQFYP